LKLDPLEAYERLVRTVEKVNALAASLVLNKAVGEDLFGEDDTKESKTRDEIEEEWTFSPEKGNVVFASAIDGWAFGISDFARMWAPRIKAKPKLLREFLWGNFGYNQKT
jgi:ribosome assembly protein 1